MSFEFPVLGGATAASEEPASQAARDSKKTEHAVGFLNALGRALGTSRAAATPASGAGELKPLAKGTPQASNAPASSPGGAEPAGAGPVARAGFALAAERAGGRKGATRGEDDAEASAQDGAVRKRKAATPSAAHLQVPVSTRLDAAAIAGQRLATASPVVADGSSAPHERGDGRAAQGTSRAQSASAEGRAHLTRESTEAGAAPAAAQRAPAFTPPTTAEPPTAAGSAARASSAVATSSLPVSNASGHQVQGAILQSAAHLRVDTPDMGALELHLRVRAGELHLRVEGQAASALQANAGELSRSLAADGLKLAALDAPSSDAGTGSGTSSGAGQGGGGQGSTAREDADDARHLPHPPPPSSPARGSQVSTGRYHVKA